jgi:GDSL-like Lipase/Acylhydrolase family
VTARSFVLRLSVLLTGLLVAVGLAEVLLRTIGKPRVLGQLYFRDQAGNVVGKPGEVGAAMLSAKSLGIIEDLPADQTPRPRARFAPGAHFWMCYEDNQLLHREWLDERGCVEVQINRFGLRERDEIAPDNKAKGERRIVCIGDSFTFGWGIPVEQCWVRKLETELRKTSGNVHTINCGASGAIVVDEYASGLRTRFGQFQPDVVIVTLCLNDLIPSSGLFVMGPSPGPTGFVLWDRIAAATHRGPLDLDPAFPWVDVLLGLGEADGTAAGLYGPDKPFSAMWSQNAPQKALMEMKAWCEQHQAKLLVVVWPFLQGLGSGRSYPFAKLHQLVSEFCSKEQIPSLDLQPVLQPLRAEDLWVTPADMHANPRAQAAVVPALTEFVRPFLAH